MLKDVKVRFLKTAHQMLPFSLLMSGISFSYTYSVIILKLEQPNELLSEIIIAGAIIGLYLSSIVSFNLTLLQIPKYFVRYMSIIIEPVLLMFVYLQALSLLGLCEISYSLKDSFLLLWKVTSSIVWLLLQQMLIGSFIGWISQRNHD